MRAFKELCQRLHLNTRAPSAKAMADFKHWYYHEVSDDEEEPVELDAARDYLDVFLPNIPSNKAEKVAAFQDMNAIQYAAAHGYVRFLETLEISNTELFNKATANAKMTPLHLAATYGHVHDVEVLLQRGADPYRKDSAAQYPIQSALFTPLIKDKGFQKRKERIFKLLKSAAPDTLSAQDVIGDTLAHKIAAMGYPELMKEIINDSPNILYLPDNFMKYPIHMAILNNQLKIVKMLLKVKDVPNLPDTNGNLALHYAARSKNRAILKACFPFYHYINIRNLENQTPLLCAAEVGNLSAVIELIKQDADFYATDYRGYNLLHYAVQANAIDLVDWILKQLPIERDAKDGAGHSVLYYAKQKGLTKICKILKSH